MRTKAVSFLYFSKSFQNKIKAERPKMTKIASRGKGPALIKLHGETKKLISSKMQF